MGFFSFYTTDTNESIPNASSNRKTFTVHMIDDKGTVYTETNYSGYGIFGTKDIFELIAEMNNFDDRIMGIEIICNRDKYPNAIFPELVRNLENATKTGTSNLDICPVQGYFYSMK